MNSRFLKPGMRVQVSNGRRAIMASADNEVWTVTSACPTRIGGKAGTEICFTNGVTAVSPTNAFWIMED